MNAQNSESLGASEPIDLPKDELGHPPRDMRVETNENPIATAGAEDVAAPGGSGGRLNQEGSTKSEGMDAGKVQNAIESMVRRIAEARARGAAGGAYSSSLHAHPRPDTRPQSQPHSARSEIPPELDACDDATYPSDASPARPERKMAALELRMRQIAELAGTPLVEDISADIAALRGKMDRLSRADGTLSNRMETIQRQLSNLRETMDTSSAPVIDRLADLEIRLEDISEALANRHLSVEARNAVEHSCSHILGAIARIEGLARQATLPDGLWDQIATVRSRIERLPTSEKIAGLERRVRDVSEQLGEVVNRRDVSEDLVTLEKRLLEMGSATRAAVEEIRERPAYNPADVRALLQRVEAWRQDRPSPDLPAVGVKLDSIARQVEQLSKSEQTSTLAKIQERLGEIASLISSQSVKLSGLNLSSLQTKLTRICDELAVGQVGRFDRSASEVPESRGQGLGHGHDEEQDKILAKRLAVRFAPEAARFGGNSGGMPAAADSVGDMSGAFDAVHDALEALVGQIPFVERGRDKPTESEDRVPRFPDAPAGQRSSDPSPNGDSINQGEKPVSLAERASPVDPGKSATEASTARPAVSASATSGAENQASYADAAHRIGRYSTWRKAKVAVVAANPPKY
jgi:hypothetical protein